MCAACPLNGGRDYLAYTTMRVDYHVTRHRDSSDDMKVTYDSSQLFFLGKRTLFNNSPRNFIPDT